MLQNRHSLSLSTRCDTMFYQTFRRNGSNKATYLVMGHHPFQSPTANDKAIPANKMEQEIYKSIWSLSPHVMDKPTYTELQRLTRELVRLYDLEGRLDEHPFSSARERVLSLPFALVNKELANGTCLITGGLGCVGTALVEALLRFDVRRIVVLDIRTDLEASAKVLEQEKVVNVTCDILDFSAVMAVFSSCRPDFVFHTAAQRDPGYAETHIADTVQTNILGTSNIVQACELLGTVKQCVFSSTGKASRYFTEEIYAGTKRMCEFILDAYAKESSVRYSMVRFTHILDNSLMDEQLKRASEHSDYVAVHSPGKFVTAQNVKEAACLMLNALIYSEEKQCKLLLVKNLEWPVESLKLALYYIKHSGRDVPAIFQGNPNGYTEKFFRGQLDWSDPAELNLLINVYENEHSNYNREADIVISHICSTNKHALEQVLRQLSEALGEEETKTRLVEGLKLLVREMLRNVPRQLTANILNWGLQPHLLEIEKAKICDYGEMIPLLFESLAGSDYYDKVDSLVRSG